MMTAINKKISIAILSKNLILVLLSCIFNVYIVAPVPSVFLVL